MTPPGGNACILLAEDNPDDEALTRRALRLRGVSEDRLVVVHDGAAALDALLGKGDHAARGPLRPMALLVDLQLPRMDGLEVLQAVRADRTLSGLPVVMLTASKDERFIVRGYHLGASAYVHKSVDFTEFLDAMGLIARYWLAPAPPQEGAP